MSAVILQESGLELSAEDSEMLKYLLENHMNLLDLADFDECYKIPELRLKLAELTGSGASKKEIEAVNHRLSVLVRKEQGMMKVFENTFVEGEKGSRKINTKKIKLLLALTYADNASTHYKGDSDGDRAAAFKRIEEAVEKLKTMIEPVLKKEVEDKKEADKKQRIKDIIGEVFPKSEGGLGAFLVTSRGFAREEIGSATKKIGDFVEERLGDEPDILKKAIREFVKTVSASG